nr:unnamed protein product [Digitaria exilis]
MARWMHPRTSTSPPPSSLRPPMSDTRSAMVRRRAGAKNWTRDGLRTPAARFRRSDRQIGPWGAELTVLCSLVSTRNGAMAGGRLAKDGPSWTSARWVAPRPETKMEGRGERKRSASTGPCRRCSSLIAGSRRLRARRSQRRGPTTGMDGGDGGSGRRTPLPLALDDGFIAMKSRRSTAQVRSGRNSRYAPASIVELPVVAGAPPAIALGAESGARKTTAAATDVAEPYVAGAVALHPCAAQPPEQADTATAASHRADVARPCFDDGC